MISDLYLDSTSEMLSSLGYEASFMENIEGGEEIAIMEKKYEDGETTDEISFFSVLPGSVKKIDYVESGRVVGNGIRFIARTEKGITKPMSFGGAWGIYVKKSS